MPATQTPPTAHSPRPTAYRGGPSGAGTPKRTGPPKEARILFQTYFKSVGPRTYAAQLKEAENGNHFLVLTEGRRDTRTGELKKTYMMVWSEDFVSFFNMLRESATFIKTHPVPDKVRIRQEKMWERKRKEAEEKAAAQSGSPAAATR